MDIKITIEFKDEFDQTQIATTGIQNVEEGVFDSDLDFIATYFEYALLALGFQQSSIEKFINRDR